MFIRTWASPIIVACVSILVTSLSIEVAQFMVLGCLIYVLASWSNGQ